MEMYVNGQWVESPTMAPIIAPYSGEVVDTVPVANADQAEQALAAAERAATTMARLTAYERSQILHRAADLLAGNSEDFARTISLEEGKPLGESRGEVGRMPDLLRLCAFEGAQIRGETLPLDAHAGAQGRLGLTLRVPCGVVLAITPFNYPLLLVIHKVGPALAAGNAVILKPAAQTPLTALKLTQLFLEAGLPENGLQCITGSGSSLGPLLCADRRVRKISFTGSTEVGEQITRVAGVKRLSLELGSNSPMIVLPDADLEQVAEATAVGGYVNAGQACISAQRILVHQTVYGDFLDALQPRVEAIKVGDPLAEGTTLSAMISERAAERVGRWVDEAVEGGARLVTGGQRQGAVFAPTIVADVKPQMRISCDELFGPAVAVAAVAGIDEAIDLANDSRYGLSAAIFTREVNNALRFAREVQTGNVMVNWTPLWRADFMPYGGLKGSGIGKEGPRYAVAEMTETKTVVFHGIDG
ncbi:MAG: aldehyde dehydrogenase family protein [Ardenticatenaceae bacterium]|nr:aldehyde dehydrogenase family protein [Ardenticatenaceae bacterium]